MRLHLEETTMALATPIVFQKSLTPAASPASIAVNEQSFTLAAGDIPAYIEGPSTGGQTPGSYGFALAVGDVLSVVPPAGFDTTLIVPVYARVGVAGGAGVGTIVIGFANLTAVAHTPQAGVYTFSLNRV
jgi:hypothetical protein